MANTIFMKVTGYDDITHSVLVSFASDSTNSQNPDDYTVYAFQPSVLCPGETNIENVKRIIAQAGIAIAESHTAKESIIANPNRMDDLKSLIGQTFSYSTEDLIPESLDDLEEFGEINIDDVGIYKI
jgi:hypothetical protein